MQTARRRRTTAAVALSVVAHLAVVTALGLYSPVLRAPEEAGGPPLAIIPLLLMPRTPPPPTGVGTRPQPVRLHQRALRVAPSALPVAPLPVPEAPKAAAPSPPGPVAVAPAPIAPPGQVRLTLRTAIGCANPDAAGLSREEREACDRRLAVGAKGAPYLGMGLDRGKQGVLDSAASVNEAQQRSRRAPLPAGVSGRGDEPGQPRGF
jgi:hypothetical protein